MEIYENSYKNSNHFSFGKNWQNFLKTLNEEKIEEAKKSLVDFLGGAERIKGKTFVDIGCGSGLFSYAAYKLGAARVLSVDVDEFSIACAKHLHEKEGNPETWQITKGSALDENFIKSLGKFDIVYSWGVLHHTGDMLMAIRNVVKLANNSSLFYLAIYNKNRKAVFEGTSGFWLSVKKIYNSSGAVIKGIMEFVYISYLLLGLAFNGKNPFRYVRDYQYSTLRGMDFLTDIKDWLGGYPYEYASVEEMKNLLSNDGFECLKCKEVRSIGCNEFLFFKK